MFFVTILALATKRQVKKRRCWMKRWLRERDRYSHIVLLRDIAATEKEDYRNYFRMDEGTYNKLLQKITLYLTREDTVMRNSISVHERLALTLRYLATGRNFEDLKYSVIMSAASISKAILETCQVLIYVLHEYIKVSPYLFNSGKFSQF